MDAKQQHLIDEIKAYALSHYEAGGWDVIVECWDDNDIAEAIAGVRSVNGAIKRLRDIVAVYADRQADGRSYAETFTYQDLVEDFKASEKEAAHKERAALIAQQDAAYPYKDDHYNGPRGPGGHDNEDNFR